MAAYDYTEGPPQDDFEEKLPQVMDEQALEALAREGKAAPGVKEVKAEIEETPWRSVRDSRTGQFYFWNAQTNETTWTNPLKKGQEQTQEQNEAYAAQYYQYYQNYQQTEQQHYAHAPASVASSGANSIPVAGPSGSPPPSDADGVDPLAKLDSILNKIETKVKDEHGHTTVDLPPEPSDSDREDSGAEDGAGGGEGAAQAQPSDEYAQKFPNWKAEFYSVDGKEKRQMGYYFDYEQWIASKNAEMAKGKRKKPNYNDMDFFRQKKEERRLKKIAKWLKDD